MSVNAADWQSIFYGNGMFVAIASDLTNNAYRINGKIWSQSTIHSYRHYYSIGYGNGKFVAVTNWTEITIPQHDWYSVCYGDGKFVAVALNPNTAVYITDGITWTESSLHTSGNWQPVCYGDSKFVNLQFVTNNAVYGNENPKTLQESYLELLARIASLEG